MDRRVHVAVIDRVLLPALVTLPAVAFLSEWIPALGRLLSALLP